MKKIRKMVFNGLLIIVGICAVNTYAYGKVSGNAYAEQLDLGYKYLLTMDYEQAEVVFENIVNMSATNYEAHLGLAQVFYAIGKSEMAEAVMEDIAGICGYGSVQVKVIEAKAGLRQFRNMAYYNDSFEAVSGLVDFCMQGLDIFLDWMERASTVIDGTVKAWRGFCSFFA